MKIRSSKPQEAKTTTITTKIMGPSELDCINGGNWRVHSEEITLCVSYRLQNHDARIVGKGQSLISFKTHHIALSN